MIGRPGNPRRERPGEPNRRAAILEDASVKLNFRGYSAVCFLILFFSPFFSLRSLCLRHVHECETVFSLLQRTTLKKGKASLERYRRAYKTVTGKRSRYFIPKLFCDVKFSSGVDSPRGKICLVYE